MNYTINENETLKKMTSPLANYIFNKKDGTMLTWGEDKDKEASRFPAPTILDIEITTICKGGCPFCYKSNTSNGSINLILSHLSNISLATSLTLGFICIG